MRLFIPRIGDVIQLAKDWSFPLYDEYRNTPLLKAVHPEVIENRNGKWGYKMTTHTTVIPAGTNLTVARVYIRNGADSYSSITFRIGADCPNKAMRKKRFWAKLADVNRIRMTEPICWECDSSPCVCQDGFQGPLD